MSFARVSPHQAVVAVALLATLVARPAAAQSAGAGVAAAAPPTAPAAASPSAAARASVDTGPLTVWIEAPDASFDQARLQAVLAHELGREIVLTSTREASAVQIRLDSAAHAEVHYTTPGGEQLSRSVELPPDRERSVQVVSWLTVNLVRDEASELLDELRARRKEEAAAAEQAAAAKAAADKAAADKAAADKAAAEKVAREAEQAKKKKLADSPTAPDEVLLRDPLRSVDVALATPISLLRDSAKRELRLQLALGYGESGAIRGFGLSPGVLRIRQDLLGVALGAGVVLVRRGAQGMVLAAGYSEVDGNLQGIQLSGGAAWQGGPVGRGAVLAGGGAFAGDFNGVVGGGGIASARSLQGAAIAVGATVIRGSSSGLLMAGGVNFSADHRGIQIAGGVNASRDLQGFALAPVNVQRRVKGIQFGIVNVAENVDGASIGILSIAKNGRVQPLLWAGNDRSVHVGIKSIAGYAFTQLGAGIDVRQVEFSYDAGIGAHLPLSKSWFLEPGVHYAGTHSTKDASGDPDQHRLSYLLQLGLRVGDKVDLLAAGGVRHTVVGASGSPVSPELRLGVGFF